MKLLVFSDMHLHSWSNFGIDSITGLSKRLIDQQKVTNQIVSIAVEEKVGGVLFLGDAIHSVGSASTEVLNTAYLFFNSFRSKSIPVYFVAGNHDLNNRKNPKWWNYSCKVFNPEVPPSNIKIIGYHESIDYETLKGYDVVAIHKTPINARVGNYTFEEGFNWKEIAKNNKVVFCGHIHQRQHLADNCIIVGSPMHLTFGDIGDRGLYLVDTDTGKTEFKKLQYPEFITVENYSDTRDDGNYYRVLEKETSISESLQTDNVKVQPSPTYLPERIKSTTFSEILKEWLQIQNKPDSYLDLLSDIVDDKFQLNKKLYGGRLSQATIKDFLSIGNVTYNVTNGFILVLGQNDTFNSNGSGKTSLFEAIYWCLFGKTTKGLTGDDVVRNRPLQQKDCRVILCLTDKDGSELHITRSRSEGLGIFKKLSDGTTYDLSGERKLTDCQKLLEQLLGFDEKLFRTSCYFSQENLLMLTGLEDADRTKMVTDLLGFESYNDLSTKAHKKIEKLEKEVSEQNDKISSTRLVIANTKGKLDTYKETLLNSEKAVTAIESTIKETTIKKRESEQELVSLKTTDLPYRDFDSEESSLETQKENHISKIALFTREINSHFEQLQKSETSHKVALNELTHATNSLKDLKGELEIIKKADEGVYCLKCGSLVSKEGKEEYLFSKAKELSTKEKKVEVCKEEVSSLAFATDTFKTIRKEHLKSLEVLEAFSLRLNTQLSDLRKERREYVTKRQEQENRKVRLQSKVQGYDEQIVEYNRQLKDIQTQVETAKANIIALTTSIDSSLKIIQEFQNVVDRLCIDVEILEFWKIAFSPKGIRALLLDKFCNEFNKIVNTYLREISSGSMGLMLTPTNTTKSGEERNKIGMTVKFKEFEVKYAALSGGEKRRVDCSLIFALSKYLEEKHELGPQGLLGVMVLDEVFGFLDKSGEDTLAELLTQESLNKAIFVIDHALNLASCASQVWTVSKTDNVSFLETTSTI